MAVRLCIKQKVFSWGDKFNVTDDFGNPRYFVQGEVFSFGHKLHVYDLYQNEVAFIRQKLMSWLPKFYVYINGIETAEIVKHFSFFTQKYSVNGLGWEVQGDFFAHDYSITCSGSYIVSIHKEWFTWGDCYVLDISDGTDEIMALAVVLAIDCVLASADSAASSSN